MNVVDLYNKLRPVLRVEMIVPFWRDSDEEPYKTPSGHQPFVFFCSRGKPRLGAIRWQPLEPEWKTPTFSQFCTWYGLNPEEGL